MKIEIYDKKEHVNDGNNDNLKLCFEEEILNRETIENNIFLEFIDSLYKKIDITKNTEIYYLGQDIKIWSYLLLFSYIDEKIRLFHESREVEESNLLKLNLENIGSSSEDIKNSITKEEYSKLPEFLKNIYYENTKECKLSEIGKLYVKNIKNKGK